MIPVPLSFQSPHFLSVKLLPELQIWPLSHSPVGQRESIVEPASCNIWMTIKYVDNCTSF